MHKDVDEILDEIFEKRKVINRTNSQILPILRKEI